MTTDPAMAGLKSIELWGGAATVSIPEQMIDASDIRPVADNQEVPAFQMNVQVLPGRLLTPENNSALAARLLRTIACMTANCEADSCTGQKTSLCDTETGQYKGLQGLLWLQVYLDSSSGQAVVVEIVVRMPVPSAWPRRFLHCTCTWPASWLLIVHST